MPLHLPHMVHCAEDRPMVSRSVGLMCARSCYAGPWADGRMVQPLDRASRQMGDSRFCIGGGPCRSMHASAELIAAALPRPRTLTLRLSKVAIFCFLLSSFLLSTYTCAVSSGSSGVLQQNVQILSRSELEIGTENYASDFDYGRGTC